MAGMPQRRVTVEELILLGGAEPPIMNSSPSEDVVKEVSKYYKDIYVPGLSHFFETEWYGGLNFNPRIQEPRSLQLLHTDKPLMGLFGSFAKHTSQPRADLRYACQLEECIVWGLANLPHHTNIPGVTSLVPAPDDAHELVGRLQVFEALLLGDQHTLTKNPLRNPIMINGSAPSRRSEFEFWWYLAEQVIKGGKQNLQNMLSLMEGKENRDFLYSIAVLRQYSHIWDPLTIESELPHSLFPSDTRSSLAVAVRFVGKTMREGCTNVIRRFAQLAFRAYVDPGVSKLSMD